jgi:amino acid permease
MRGLAWVAMVCLLCFQGYTALTSETVFLTVFNTVLFSLSIYFFSLIIYDWGREAGIEAKVEITIHRVQDQMYKEACEKIDASDDALKGKDSK